MWRTCQAAWAAAHAPTSASASRSCRARLVPQAASTASGEVIVRTDERPSRGSAAADSRGHSLSGKKRHRARVCSPCRGVCLSVCLSKPDAAAMQAQGPHPLPCLRFARAFWPTLLQKRARPAGGRASPRAGAATPAGAPLPCLCSGRSHPCHAHLGGWGAREAGGGRRPDRSHAAAPLAALGVAGRADPSLSGCCGCPLNCRPPRDAGRGELAGVGDAAGAAGGTDPTAAG